MNIEGSTPDSQAELEAQPTGGSATGHSAFLLWLQRSAFAYLLIYVTPALAAMLPALGFLAARVRTVRTEVGAWVGEHLLGLEGPLNRAYDGSGDRLVDFLWVGTALLVSSAVATIWTLVSKSRSNPLRAPWFRTGCRYALAATLLGYGLGKGSQFRPQGLERLLDSYGDSSPMGLLWTFMAFSPIYKLFAGAVECAAAALLLTRRTTLLGAALAMTALGNILVLDLSFHVPAKLLVMHLLLLAALLAGPNLDRLWDLFIRGRQPRAPWVDPPFFKPKTPRRVAKTLLVLWLLYLPITRAATFARHVGFARTLPSSHGLYVIERFSRSGEQLDPSDTDRWVRMIVEYDGNVRVFNRNDDYLDYFAEFAADGSTWTLGPWREQKALWPLEVERGEGDRLSLRGVLEGVPLELTATRKSLEDFPLTRSRPRWVIETPENR